MEMSPQYDYMISHQYTGVDLARVEAQARQITEVLRGSDKTCFYSNEFDAWFKEQGWDYDTSLAWCIEEQKKSRNMIFMIVEAVESNGMKAELSLAQELGIPGMLIVNESVKELPWVQPFIEYCDDVHTFAGNLTSEQCKEIIA